MILYTPWPARDALVPLVLWIQPWHPEKADQGVGRVRPTTYADARMWESQVTLSLQACPRAQRGSA